MFSLFSLIFTTWQHTNVSLLRSNHFQMCLILPAFLVFSFSSTSSSSSCVFLSLPSHLYVVLLSPAASLYRLSHLSVLLLFIFSSGLYLFLLFLLFSAVFQSPLSLFLTHSLTLLVRLCRWSLLMFSLSGGRAICDSNVWRQAESIRWMSWGGGVTAKAAH